MPLVPVERNGPDAQWKQVFPARRNEEPGVQAAGNADADRGFKGPAPGSGQVRKLVCVAATGPPIMSAGDWRVRPQDNPGCGLGKMFKSIRQYWAESMEIDAVRWVVWGTILLMMLAVAIYVVGRLRAMFYDTAPDRHSYLGTFRDLRDQGLIEDEEFARLRQNLTGEGGGTAAGGGGMDPKAATESPGKPKTAVPPN